MLCLILIGIKFKKNIPNGWSGIRTHEAEAVDLKSTPFDRSGIQPKGQVPLKPLSKLRGETLRIGIEPMTSRLTVVRSNQLS